MDEKRLNEIELIVKDVTSASEHGAMKWTFDLRDLLAMIAEINRLRDALEFYAAFENWCKQVDTPWDPSDGSPSKIAMDAGRIAINALGLEHEDE